MLRQLLHNVKRFSLRSVRAQVEVHPSTRLLRHFGVTFMTPPAARRYLTVGAEGMLNANVTFESTQGLVEIGDRVYMGAQTSIISRNSIRIGNDVTMAWGVTLYDHNSHSLDWRQRRKMVGHFHSFYGRPECFGTLDWSGVDDAPIVIGDRVWIGFDAVILKGVTVGTGAIIGARSVVSRNVEPYTVVAGNPARVVKTLGPELRQP